MNMLKAASKNSFYSKETYEFHEYAEIFPLMGSDEIGKLGKSIKDYGQEQDIILYKDKILDGRNTYLACRGEGIIPRFSYYNSKLDPLEYVRIKNLHRRHLSAAQRAAVALVFLQIERKRAKERITRTYFNNPKKKFHQKCMASNPRSLAINEDKKGRAIDIVAKEHKIAPKTLIKAEKIDEASKKYPEIREKWERAKKNKISLEEVYRAVQKKNEIKIKEGIIDKFVETGHNLTKKECSLKIQKNRSFNLERKERESENKCQHCSKATVFAITCEMCGHPTPRVLCDNDFINNNKRLVNPNQKKCVYSLSTY